jgi:2-polyprenyl-6-methoxyphenol hydroxylase-like FAD-dependent oxidoreductase
VKAPRVAVVGAGVAGSAAAVALARQGCEVHLFEAAAQPRAEGAGLLLQPTGLAMLGALGLADAVCVAGARVDHLYGDTPTGRAVLDMRYARLGEGQFGLGIQRTALLGALWQAVRGEAVHWHLDAPVAGYSQQADGVRLQVDRTGRVTAEATAAAACPFDLLVLANGAFSRLRALMAVRQRQRLYPWGALWCLLPLPATWQGLQLRQRYRSAQQMLGLMPVGRGLPEAVATAPLLTLFWSMPHEALQTWQHTPDLAALKRQMLELWPQAADVLGSLHQAHQLRLARYADVWMQTWHDGTVVAIGDCAHGMSPQLGQGANMGLIDALTLAQELATARQRGQAPGQAAAAYSARRRSHLRFYQRASRWLTPLFQSHARAGPALRDLFFGYGGRLPYVERESVAALAGLKTGWLHGRVDLPRLDPTP